MPISLLIALSTPSLQSVFLSAANFYYSLARG
jgi:hypothetical protein